jgi:hypothetical protein
MRSPNYPNTSLATAIESARRFYGKAQQASVHADDAVKYMGYQGPSGAARSRLAALRQYGLVEDTKEGVRLTELGLAILHPSSDDERREALSAAALTPPLFKELWNTHKNVDASVIAGHLIRSKHFSSGGAQQAADAFKANTDIVKAPPEGYSKLIDVSDAGSGIDAVTVGTGRMVGRVNLEKALAVLWQQTQPLANGLSAEIRVVGEPGRDVRVEDLRRLRKFLDLGIEALEEEGARYAPPSAPDDASSSRS